MAEVLGSLPDLNYWRGKRVLLTGHTGFKGTWLSAWLTKLGAEVLGLSKLDLPSSPSLWCDTNQGLKELRYDLLDEKWFEDALDFQPQVIFHLAAQSIVATGYLEPFETFRVNTLGTAKILEFADSCEYLESLVIVTTDKVYFPGSSEAFRETSALGGKDPYAASKAASEIVVQGWQSKSRVGTARAGNVIGGGDWSKDRLIPDLVRSFITNTELKFRNLNGVRPWQHVLEPLLGYIKYAEYLANSSGELVTSLNFGPNSENIKNVGEVISSCQKYWYGNSVPIISMRQNLKAYKETEILLLNSELAHEALGWKSILNWDETLSWTIDWYKNFHSERPALQLIHEDIEKFETLTTHKKDEK